jgi:hypothetical protein
MKGKNDVHKMYDVIYSMSCSHCEEAYIAQTNRCLGIRLMEHEKSIDTTWAHPEHDPAAGECAVAEHYRKCGACN